ncbi:MAG: hypothetical protein R3B95_07735 [Nitrospirales bacterium]|nr:hypothetical protein [Nitrospirales bacterium]
MLQLLHRIAHHGQVVLFELTKLLPTSALRAKTSFNCSCWSSSNSFVVAIALQPLPRLVVVEYEGPARPRNAAFSPGRVRHLPCGQGKLVPNTLKARAFCSITTDGPGSLDWKTFTTFMVILLQRWWVRNR